MRDTRWPAALFLVARSVQAVLALVAMGIACRFASGFTNWYIGYTIAISFLTIIYIIINITLFFNGLLLPMAIVIVEPILFLFWLITTSAIGTDNAYTLSHKCGIVEYYAIEDYTLLDRDTCSLLKAGFAFCTLEMILFIPTIVMTSMAMHQTRDDLSGIKHNMERKTSPTRVVAPSGYGQYPHGHGHVQQDPQQYQYQQHQQDPQQYPQLYQQDPQQYAHLHQQYQHPQQQEYQYGHGPQRVDPQIYQPSIPELQSPVYPSKTTGSPAPYQRNYTTSPPPKGDPESHEMPAYAQGNQRPPNFHGELP